MKVGDKVVCVNDSNQTEAIILVIKNEYYTITDVVLGGLGVNVAEASTARMGFFSNRFRKIDEHNFTNALTEKLAREAMKEIKEYIPLKVEPKTVEV